MNKRYREDKKYLLSKYTSREEYWQLMDKDNIERLKEYKMEKEDCINPYAVDYHMKKKDFLHIATSIMHLIKLFMFSDMQNEINELVGLGEKYIKKAIEIEDRNTGLGKRLSPEYAEVARNYLYYEYTWLKTKKENIPLLRKICELDKKFVEEDKKKKKYAYLYGDRRDVIDTSIRIGEFKTAKKYVWELAKKKETSNRIKKDLDVIFEEKDFLILITGYLAEPEKNKELYPIVMKCFDKFFEEHYHRPYVVFIGYSSLWDLMFIPYIKYKYFSEKDVELDPFEIVQSLRYGYRCKYKNKENKSE